MRPQLTLSHKISEIIGAEHPDLAPLCVRILRSQHSMKFDTTAALELLKAGMKASDVREYGLDATWRLSQQFSLGAAPAAQLMASIVNTFAVDPQFFGIIPSHVASVARALE